jgi:plasmid stability protein
MSDPSQDLPPPPQTDEASANKPSEQPVEQAPAVSLEGGVAVTEPSLEEGAVAAEATGLPEATEPEEKSSEETIARVQIVANEEGPSAAPLARDEEGESAASRKVEEETSDVKAVEAASDGDLAPGAEMEQAAALREALDAEEDVPPPQVKAPDALDAILIANTQPCLASRVGSPSAQLAPTEPSPRPPAMPPPRDVPSRAESARAPLTRKNLGIHLSTVRRSQDVTEKWFEEEPTKPLYRPAPPLKEQAAAKPAEPSTFFAHFHERERRTPRAGTELSEESTYNGENVELKVRVASLEAQLAGANQVAQLKFDLDTEKFRKESEWKIKSLTEEVAVAVGGTYRPDCKVEGDVRSGRRKETAADDRHFIHLHGAAEAQERDREFANAAGLSPRPFRQCSAGGVDLGRLYGRSEGSFAESDTIGCAIHQSA